MMVKFRGICIHVVSQIDARRLPEHNTATIQDNHNSVISCQIPIYRGAQVWFDYSIDGPHPPGTMYLFKLSVNGHDILNWDCTSKHDYHGKVAYCLYDEHLHKHKWQVTYQNSFIFSTRNPETSPDTKDDLVEIRVHRLRDRRRVHQLPSNSMAPSVGQQGQSVFRLAHKRIIEPNRPARRYQYLLLDPQDEPYAIFRFNCHTDDFYESLQIFNSEKCSSHASVCSSLCVYYDAETSSERKNDVQKGEGSMTNPFKQLDHIDEALSGFVRSSEKEKQERGVETIEDATYSHLDEHINILRGSRSLVVRDSLEDISCAVSRLPRASLSQISGDLSYSSRALNCDTSTNPSLRRSMLPPPSRDWESQSLERLQPRTQKDTIVSKKVLSTSLSDLELKPSTCKTNAMGSPSSIAKTAKPNLRNPELGTKQSRLKLSLMEAASDLNRKISNSSIVSVPTSRPLSPFTRAGFLRRMGNSIGTTRPATDSNIPTPSSAPPAVTIFGPSVQDEVSEAMKLMLAESGQRTIKKCSLDEHQPRVDRTTRAQRSGNSLISLLSKRTDKAASLG